MSDKSGIPTTFDPFEYIKWHERVFPQDVNLPLKIERLREELFIKAKSDLIYLNSMWMNLFRNAKKEYYKREKIKTDFMSPLNDLLRTKNAGLYKEKIFKGTTSIVDKLWRKNKEEKFDFTFSNIKSDMTDLVRTEIICTSLSACKFLSDKFNSENELKKSIRGRTKLDFDKYISKIQSESEMKMSSGYFAYHSLLFFQSGLVMEVQFHSSLSSRWRDLSHDLYKVTRLSPIDRHEYGGVASRIIYLGHVLHIVDFELERLEKEFYDETRRRKSH